jgi:predicted dehydrogenase
MINAALIGLGGWGQRLVTSVHGKSSLISIVHCVTRSPDKVTEFAHKTGIPVTSSLSDVLGRPDIDAVIIATPHSQHVSQVIAAAQAGKHVFVEKPLALHTGEVDSAFAACKRAGVILAVGQNRRLLLSVRHIRQILSTGQLGTLLHLEGNFSGPSGFRSMTSSWRGSSTESPSGGMTGKGLHISYLMISFAGPVSSITARSLHRVPNTKIEDTTFMLMTFASGATGYLSTITATADYWRLALFGTAGILEMRGENKVAMRPVDGHERVQTFEATDTERLELEAFAQAILGGDPYPVPHADVRNNIALLEAAGESAASNREIHIESIPC